MKTPRISLIAAINKTDLAIGRDNDLLFRIADDLRRFKALTTGHPVIMGRKTFDSIGRPLPGRQNLVITRNRELQIPGTIICASLEEALDKASDHEDSSGNLNKEVFVIGGGEIYKQALPSADRLYLTIADSQETGNIFFPDYSDFKKVIEQEDRVDPQTRLKYTWITLEK